MSITYEDALATLQSMFGEPWNRDSLDTVLRHQKGHMENTVDLILRHGNQDPEILIDQIESGVDPMQSVTAADEALARQLSQQSVSFSGAIGNLGRPSSQGVSASKSGIGNPTTLPEDFLRPPGYTPGMTNNVRDDEALARMLQDELFTEELRRNPDFAHLARGRASDARLPNTSVQNPAQAAANRLGEFARSWSGSSQPRSADNTVPPSPNILEKISELGDNAKRRLQLLAAQFNANNSRGPATETSNSGRAPEFRSLLDHDDDNMELAARKDL